jgi:hypothetical protein
MNWGSCRSRFSVPTAPIAREDTNPKKPSVAIMSPVVVEPPCRWRIT